MPDLAQSATIAANGTANLAFSPTARQSWEIKQISFNGRLVPAAPLNGGALINCFLDTSFICVLASPQDVADSPPYVLVNNGRTFWVRVTAGTPGISIQAVILYDEKDT